MSSLRDIVTAMSKETLDSTLNWDVVVNYTTEELNRLLEASYKTDQKSQLQKLLVTITGYDQVLQPFTIEYTFKLGAPLIQFGPYGTTPVCSLKIPINDGTIETSAIKATIKPGIYSLVLSDIPIASINDGPYSKPQPGDKPFYFPSPDTVGVVTLDLITSSGSLKAEILNGNPNMYPEPDFVKFIKAQKGNIEGKITDFFKVPENVTSIRWDLARVSNNRPPSGSQELVPKSFRFAAYDQKGSTNRGVLSLFIQTDATQRGMQDELTSRWRTKWSEYRVSPIPDSHTASIIFNNRLITDFIKKSLSDKNMSAERIPQAGGGFKLKVLTHKTFNFPGKTERPPTPANHVQTYSGASVDLDKEALFINLGQNANPDSNASATLEWGFAYRTSWSQSYLVDRQVIRNSGDLTITNKLKKSKYFDNSRLSKYVLRLDATITKDDWDKPDVKADQPSVWRIISGGKVGWAPPWVRDNLPDLPGFELQLVDFDFFLTTNLLLPGHKVINIDSNSGVRFPLDVYLVGHIAQR